MVVTLHMNVGLHPQIFMMSH